MDDGSSPPPAAIVLIRLDEAPPVAVKVLKDGDHPMRLLVWIAHELHHPLAPRYKTPAPRTRPAPATAARQTRQRLQRPSASPGRRLR